MLGVPYDVCILLVFLSFSKNLHHGNAWGNRDGPGGLQPGQRLQLPTARGRHPEAVCTISLTYHP